MIVEAPAGTYLFDSYDRVLMHYRRYDMPALLSLLRTAGSVIEPKSHLGLLLSGETIQPIATAGKGRGR